MKRYLGDRHRVDIVVWCWWLDAYVAALQVWIAVNLTAVTGAGRLKDKGAGERLLRFCELFGRYETCCAAPIRNYPHVRPLLMSVLSTLIEFYLLFVYPLTARILGYDILRAPLNRRRTQGANLC